MQSSSAPIKSVIPNGEIMRVIWTLGKSDAQEVTALLSESKRLETATVKTLLGRLVKKGVLRTETQGKNLFIILWFPRMLRFKSATESLFSHICAKKSAKHWQK